MPANIDTNTTMVEQTTERHLSHQDAAKMANTMQSTLTGLEGNLRTFNEQANAFNGVESNLDITAELEDMRERLRSHRKTQNLLISGAKRTIRHDFKEQVTDRLREDMSAKIKSEIALQVKNQVDMQIQGYIPVPLEQQVMDNKRQISEIKVSLFNSEARARNSALEIANLDEPLMPILKLDGNRSTLFPADLRSLFSYDLGMSKALVKDFEIEGDDETLHVNYGRFMRHIGIEKVQTLGNL